MEKLWCIGRGFRSDKGTWSCLSVPNTETGQVAKSVLGVLLGRGCAESVSHWATAHQSVIRDPMEMVGGIPGKGWSVGWVSGSFQVTVTGAAQASPELPDCIMWV